MLTSQLVEQGRLNAELALPLKGWLFIHPVTDLHRALWTKGWGVTESCMCPFPLTKLGPFCCFSLRSGSCGTSVMGKVFQVSEFLLCAIYMLLIFCEATCCSKLAVSSSVVLRQYEEFVLFCLNAFHIVQKQCSCFHTSSKSGCLQLFRQHSADCWVSTIPSSHQSHSSSSLYTDNLCLDSFVAFPFIICFLTRHVPFLHGGSILNE